MTTNDDTRRFEADRARLCCIAYRMLGSLHEAEDAVQEAWLRLHEARPAATTNISAWLTTVVSRIAIDMLRARGRRKETVDGEAEIRRIAATDAEHQPEREQMLAETVGIACLLILERLRPAERIAFVLHDMHATPFGEIAEILKCSHAAARQHASRARRAMRASSIDHLANAALSQHYEIVQAFAAASRAGDLTTLLRILDPDVTLEIDAALTGGAGNSLIHGAQNVAERARFGAAQNAFATNMLIDGEPGIAVAVHGTLQRVMTFTLAGSQITRIRIIANPALLSRLDFHTLA